MTERSAETRPRSRRSFWLWAGIVASIAVVVVGWCRLDSVKPVNLLFITLDTTRADRIGCYGDSRAVTPVLDGLARRGTLFERAYAPAPMTAPSHVSMFTGLFPPEHGVWTNGGVSVPAELPLLAETLQRRGYTTAGFVSSVVLEPNCGLNRGFEVYNAELTTIDPGHDDDGHGRYRDGKHAVDAVLKWLTTRLAKPAPFFCWLHLFDPHEPYLAHEEEFGQEFADRPYDAEVAYVDRQLGRLFSAMEKQGLLNQTVVVVVGDHGESLGEHGEQQHGYLLHESTLRVPLIIATPQEQSPGRRVSTPVSLVDLYPTMHALCGLAPPAAGSLRNLLPALLGKPLSPRTCYSQTLEGYQEARWSPLQGLTTDRWRYVRTTQPELYDLEADPRELRNLAGELPDLVSEFDGELAQFLQGLTLHSGSQRTLSDREMKSLESLGYAGAANIEPDKLEFDPERPDIKDMIVHLNGMFDARKLMGEQRFQEAEKILRPIAETVPNFLRARFSLATTLYKLGQLEEAAQWFEATLEVDSNYQRAHEALGVIYIKLRQLDLAERHLLALAELNPTSEGAYLYLGEIAQRREQFSQAMQLYAKTLKLNPRNRQAHEAFQALYNAGIRP